MMYRIFDRIHHEQHLYLVDLKDWKNVKAKVKLKIDMMKPKLKQRKDFTFTQYLKLDNIKDPDLLQDLARTILENDLPYSQIETTINELESYISENDYHDGRKQSLRLLTYNMKQKIKCVTCTHSMGSHEGNWSEGKCTYGTAETCGDCKKGCTKLVIKEEHKKMLAQ